MKNIRLYTGLAAALCLPIAAQAQAALGYNISTIAGNATQGYGGDGGAPTGASFNNPLAAVPAGGNIYIADQLNNRIRYVSGGKISTLAGTGTAGYNQYTGQATNDNLSNPAGVAVDSSGNLYISDFNNCAVVKVTTSGIMSLYAGTASLCGFGGDVGPAAGSILFHPSGLTLDSSGNLYIADTGNNAIRKVTASTGVITTIVGNGNAGYQDGLLGKGVLNNPQGVAIDSAGNLYIADTNNQRIRKVANGLISTIAGSGGLIGAFSGDGLPATQAQLNVPRSVAVDSAGNIYIADFSNNRIRAISAATGTISTIAGNGAGGYSGDGGAALQAALKAPSYVAVDGSGNVIVTDNNNNVIRQLTPVTSAPPGGAPTVTGVASASAFGNFAGVAAPGSWIEIYGTNLAADTRSWTGKDFSGVNAPMSLDGTSVTIGNQPAPVFYISSSQLDVQVPGTITGGSPGIVVTNGAGTSTAFPLSVNFIQPGVFAPPTFNVGGKQYAGALFPDNTTFVMPPGAVSGITSRQAKPGDTITFYGVGFGAVTPDSIPVSGQIVSGLSSLPGFSVFFGNTQAAIQYAGLTPGQIGLYQFNVVVPNVPNNDAVKLTFILDNSNNTQTLYTAVHN